MDRRPFRSLVWKNRLGKRVSITAAVLMLLASSAYADDAQRDFVQKGPWLVRDSRDSRTGLTEHVAMTPSRGKSNFWIGFSCPSDRRVYMFISRPDAALILPDEKQSPFEIRFDGGDPIVVETKLANSRTIAVDPEIAKNLLIDMIHSDRVAVRVVNGLLANESFVFDVQPVLPAFEQVIDDCIVRKSQGPA